MPKGTCHHDLVYYKVHYMHSCFNIILKILHQSLKFLKLLNVNVNDSLTSEITDEVSFARRDQHLHVCSQMKQV